MTDKKFKAMMMKNAEKAVGRPVSDDELHFMVANTCRNIYEMLKSQNKK